MADPVKITRSLEQVATGYSVFERDQVLTDTQLNSVTQYLDDQQRLTRVELLGVGIVGGLRVAVAGGNSVTVSKGLGVTTDGDLLMLAADTTYDRIKPYDTSAPVYPPFYAGETMLTLYELIAEGESDVRAQPMSTLPATLPSYVVLMLMESYEQDPGLCSGTDCDNLGKDAVNTVRMLLVSRSDAATLLSPLASSSSAALALPELFADRPTLGSSLTTAAALATQYRNACNNIHATLAANLGALQTQLPTLLSDLFNGNPAPGWVTQLTTIKNAFASSDTGIQYYYDFLKDVVTTWNALRELLFHDGSVFMPDLGAFPKHLLLGDLSNPAGSRTGLYPSPLVSQGAGLREHARFLAWKLHILINTFTLPSTAATSSPTIVITPSRDEASELEERAIPYYYAVRSDLPIHRGWNYRLTMRGNESRNLGFRASEYGGAPVALNPFGSQIGRYDFFRIEGHLGQDVGTVTTLLNAQIKAKNLPIAVRAVLLHTDPIHIIIRPPFRYTPWHGLHYLLRNDVATQLSDSKNFNLAFTNQISSAVSNAFIPATITYGSTTQATNDAAKQHADTINSAIDKAVAPLGATRYSSYRASLTSTAGNWKSSYNTAVSAVGTYKLNFGAMVRTEFSTPFDSLMINNHGAWLDWLDNLIDNHNSREDNKLLFSSFIDQHPGLEHCGGVSAGGTFVLAYDDKSKIVADFMLPYYAPDLSDPEPEEPVLTPPIYRPPLAINQGLTLLKPIDLQLIDFTDTLKPQWQQDIKIQTDYQTFFTNSLKTLDTVFNIKGISAGNVTGVTGGYTTSTGGFTTNYGDGMLNMLMGQVYSRQNQVEQLQAIVLQADTPADVRETAQSQLKDAQNGLAQAISDSTQYIAKNQVDVTSSGGSLAITNIAAGMDKVTDSAAVANLKNGLQTAISGASGAQFNALNSLGALKGF